MPVRFGAVAIGAIASVLALASEGTNASGGQGIRLLVDVPSWAGRSHCRVEANESAIVPSTELPRLAVPCNGETGVVRCDFADAEPLDVLTSRLCETKRLPVVSGVPVVVGTDSAGADLEWLDVRDPGRVLARRRIQADDGLLRLLVQPGPMRLVRFLAGGSPVTVTGETLAAQTWRLPAPRPGGELVIVTGPGRVLPDSYRLSGPVSIDLARRDRVVSAYGMPSGDYAVTPLYGELGGTPASATVLAGQSVRLDFDAESVGAVEVTADEHTCLNTEDLQLAELVEVTDSAGGRARVRRTVWRRAHEGNCRRVVPGLAAGRYEIGFIRPAGGGTFIAKTVDVRPQEISSVTFEAQEVVIAGAVTFNGRVVPELLLELAGVPREGTASVLTPAFHGQFSVVLSHPGSYTLRVRDPRLHRLGVETRIAVTEGYNWLEWDARGGTIEVAVRGWDGSAPVDVTLLRQKPDFLGAGTRVERLYELPLVLSGLGFGEYRIDARQPPLAGTGGRRMTSELVVVALDEEHSHRRVELTLADRAVLLKLLDAESRPVHGAQVSGLRANPAEIEPGVFSLAGIPTGTPLTILSQFAPLCTVLSGHDMEIVLGNGRAMDLEFDGLELGADSPVGSIVWPGGDCPVRLSAFRFQRLSVPTEKPLRFRIFQFPATPVTFHYGSLLPQAIPADAPVARVRVR